MTPQFQYAVVGRGLTGAAAARHLAEQVSGVVLIGPDAVVRWSYVADSPGDLPGANLLFDALAPA